MSKIMKFDKLKVAKRFEDPFTFYLTEDLFEDPEGLYASYPQNGFQRKMRCDGSDKVYSFSYASDRSVLEHNIDKKWVDLINCLNGLRYKLALSEVLGVDLSDVSAHVGFYNYDVRGDWVSPHLDKKEKKATHVLFFNRRWTVEDGGCFVALNSERMVDVSVRILPLLGSSVIFRPSEDSWHAVEPLCSDGVRQSIQVEFW